MIPFVDLNAQYQSIKSEIDKAISNCINEGNFIKGKAVSDFEHAFARYHSAGYCIGCGNGTDALEIILKSLKIGQGDEVIVPALSWIATSECVNNVGAEPVFVDINLNNFTIDVSQIENKITPRTRAIIPVHLYGYPADIKQIMLIAEKHKLFVIEDCAQAHGAEYQGQKVGTFGIAAAFSFFPSKNLGAFGDGGAIVTSDANLAENARMISNHGQLFIKHSHKVIGRNSRLDTIQASVLNVKLKYLDKWNQNRSAAAHYYRSRLYDSNKLVLPEVDIEKKHVYHLFVLRCFNRISLIELLEKNDISFGIHYPTPLPFIEAYKYMKLVSDDFPVASKLTKEIISLPIYPEITEDQIETICKLILEKF
jgi:dTDP-4-amino-4,6-dideoxygalactose transaminase